MVAARVLVHLRRAAKLAHRNDERIRQHAALIEIADERGEALIEGRHFLVEVLENLLVMVPAAAVHGDKAHAAFDEPAGHEAALAELVVSVFVAQFRVLLRDVEGGLRLW